MLDLCTKNFELGIEREWDSLSECRELLENGTSSLDKTWLNDMDLVTDMWAIRLEWIEVPGAPARSSF